MQHAHFSSEERARILAALRFPPSYPNLNATWSRLKARLPRLCAHVGSIQVNASGTAVASIALVRDEADSPDAATFPLLFGHRWRRQLAREHGLNVNAGRPHARLTVDPDVENFSEPARTAVLCHELAHVQQLLTFSHFTVVYALESSAATYFQNRFEVAARLVGTKRGISEMCPMPPRWAAVIARTHCDRQRAGRCELLPDYDVLAAGIRKLRGKGRGSRRSRKAVRA